MFPRSFFHVISPSRRSGHSSSARKIKTFRPTFEPLEQRMLLSITMAQWSTQDIVYTTADTSGNWYTDSRQLQVTFTPPSGSGLSPIVVKGFWDGGSTFVARFTPTTTGTWTYSTADSTITNLTNQTEVSGSQIVVGARTPATTALCASTRRIRTASSTTMARTISCGGKRIMTSSHTV